MAELFILLWIMDVVLYVSQIILIVFDRLTDHSFTASLSKCCIMDSAHLPTYTHLVAAIICTPLSKHRAIYSLEFDSRSCATCFPYPNLYSVAVGRPSLSSA